MTISCLITMSGSNLRSVSIISYHWYIIIVIFFRSLILNLTWKFAESVGYERDMKTAMRTGYHLRVSWCFAVLKADYHCWKKIYSDVLAFDLWWQCKYIRLCKSIWRCNVLLNYWWHFKIAYLLFLFCGLIDCFDYYWKLKWMIFVSLSNFLVFTHVSEHNNVRLLMATGHGVLCLWAKLLISWMWTFLN